MKINISVGRKGCCYITTALILTCVCIAKAATATMANVPDTNATGLSGNVGHGAIAGMTATSKSVSAIPAASNGITNVAATTTTPPYFGGGMTSNIPACNEPLNLSGLALPGWYEHFWRRYESVLCNLPFFDWTDDYTRATAIDRKSQKQVPWQASCDLNAEYAKLHIFADYYASFYGLVPYAGPHVSGKGYPKGSAEKITHMISFVCSPIAFFTLFFGVFVIRKILKKGDSHLFIYHFCLILADVCCYVLNTSHVTDFAQWAMTPLCYTSFYLAAGPFTNFAPLTWIAHESAAFGLSNLVQALLAADRYLSVSLPIWYRQKVNSGFAAKTIFGVIFLNTVVWVGQLSMTVPWQQFLIGATIHSSRFQPFYKMQALFGATRAVMFVLSWATQIIGCSLTFWKVWKIKSARSKSKGTNGEQISMVPCLLLVGTCIINLAGCTSMSLYMMMFFIIRPLEQGWVGQINGHQLTFIPILNNLGFYIHCFVCKEYRLEVARLMFNALRRTKAFVTCKTYVPLSWVGNVQVGAQQI